MPAENKFKLERKAALLAACGGGSRDNALRIDSELHYILGDDVVEAILKVARSSITVTKGWNAHSDHEANKTLLMNRWSSHYPADHVISLRNSEDEHVSVAAYYNLHVITIHVDDQLTWMFS